MSRPNFFLIGAPRCGTTALSQHLQEHKQIYISEPKEPFYWSRDFPGMRHASGIDSLAKYEQLFADVPAGKTVVGEASTLYLASGVAIKQCLEYSPNAKFLVIVRDPMEVAQSFYNQLKRTFNEDAETFEEAWRLQEARQEGRSIPPGCREPRQLQYREIVSLGSQLANFFDLVPANQRLVVCNRDMRSDPQSVLKQIYQFLEVEPDDRASIREVNASSQYRSAFAGRILRLPAVRFLANSTKRVLPVGLTRIVQRTKNVLLSKKLPKQGQAPGGAATNATETSSSLLEEIRAELAIESQLVEQLTGRSLVGASNTVSSAIAK